MVNIHNKRKGQKAPTPEVVRQPNQENDEQFDD